MKRYKISEEFFGGLIRDNVNSDVFSIDKVTINLLKFIYGKIEYKQFLDYCTDNLTLQELIELLSEFLNLGILQLNAEMKDNAISDRKCLSSPLRVFYDITYACNLSCKHCFTESGNKRKDELTLNEKFDLVSQLAQLDIGRISIAGGEPFASNDFFPFIEKCKENSIEVSVSTNGTLLDVNTVNKLNDFNLKTLTVSLDGGTENSNDIIRGEGSFKKTLQGLYTLKELYKYNYSIKATLMKTNLSEIEQIVLIGIKTGCNSVKFNCVREDGRAEINKDLLLLNREEYIQVVKTIEEIKLKYKDKMKIRAPLNVFCEDEYEYIPELGFGCFAGKESICVDPLGNVRPCSHFPEEYICGNIRNKTLSEIWKTSNILKQFQTFKGNKKCLSCEEYDKCRGGCRYRTYLTGDINGIDPYCFKELSI